MSEGQPEDAAPPTEQPPEGLVPQDTHHPSGSPALAAAREAMGEQPSGREAIAGLMHSFEHRFDDPGSKPKPEGVVIPINDADQTQEPGANREADIHKAETMAYAEGDFRTKAVENRKAFGPSSKEAAEAREVEDKLFNQSQGRIEAFDLQAN